MVCEGGVVRGGLRPLLFAPRVLFFLCILKYPSLALKKVTESKKTKTMFTSFQAQPPTHRVQLKQCHLQMNASLPLQLQSPSQHSHFIEQKTLVCLFVCLKVIVN